MLELGKKPQTLRNKGFRASSFPITIGSNCLYPTESEHFRPQRRARRARCISMRPCVPVAAIALAGIGRGIGQRFDRSSGRARNFRVVGQGRLGLGMAGPRFESLNAHPPGPVASQIGSKRMESPHLHRSCRECPLRQIGRGSLRGCQVER